jgi:hypothetical protein
MEHPKRDGDKPDYGLVLFSMVTQCARVMSFPSFVLGYQANTPNRVLTDMLV